MNHPTLRLFLPILHLLPHGMRSHRHRRPRTSELTARQTTSTPLDRGSILTYCAVCIQAGRATEATYQTGTLLCGCAQHIRELEQEGLAAVRRARLQASSRPYTAAPTGATATAGTQSAVRQRL